MKTGAFFYFLFCVVQVFYVLVAEVSEQVVEQDDGGVVFRDGPDSGGNCGVSAGYCG
jgi:hypothetical protein